MVFGKHTDVSVSFVLAHSVTDGLKKSVEKAAYDDVEKIGRYLSVIKRAAADSLHKFQRIIKLNIDKLVFKNAEKLVARAVQKNTENIEIIVNIIDEPEHFIRAVFVDSFALNIGRQHAEILLNSLVNADKTVGYGFCDIKQKSVLVAEANVDRACARFGVFGNIAKRSSVKTLFEKFSFRTFDKLLTYACNSVRHFIAPICNSVFKTVF